MERRMKKLKKNEDAELLNMFTKAQGLNEQCRNSVKVMFNAFIFQKEMKNDSHTKKT